MPGSASRFRTAVERLRAQISHWTPSRFAAEANSRFTAAASAPVGGSRGDEVHALVQRLAELAADAEGEPRRAVPRLTPDTALPDQLTVLATDLLAANPDDEVLERATAEITATAQTLT
jgi:hypothetical protein